MASTVEIGNKTDRHQTDNLESGKRGLLSIRKYDCTCMRTHQQRERSRLQWAPAQTLHYQYWPRKSNLLPNGRSDADLGQEGATDGVEDVSQCPAST